MSAKAGKDGTEVVQVLLESTTIHEDIVEVHNYVLIKHIEKDLVHQPLKGRWSVGEPKRHHPPLKETTLNPNPKKTL